MTEEQREELFLQAGLPLHTQRLGHCSARAADSCRGESRELQAVSGQRDCSRSRQIAAGHVKENIAQGRDSSHQM